MKITDAFLGEHGAIYAQLTGVEQLLERSPTLEQIQTAATFLIGSLWPHSALEDDLLFGAAIERMGHPDSVLSVMHEEHAKVGQYLHAAQAATRVETAREELLRALDLTREHFLKEEQVAFPLSEQLLGAEELERLGTVWAEKRGVVLEGAG